MKGHRAIVEAASIIARLSTITPPEGHETTNIFSHLWAHLVWRWAAGSKAVSWCRSTSTSNSWVFGYQVSCGGAHRCGVSPRLDQAQQRGFPTCLTLHRDGMLRLKESCDSWSHSELKCAFCQHLLCVLWPVKHTVCIAILTGLLIFTEKHVGNCGKTLKKTVWSVPVCLLRNTKVH